MKKWTVGKTFELVFVLLGIGSVFAIVTDLLTLGLPLFTTLPRSFLEYVYAVVAVFSFYRAWRLMQENVKEKKSNEAP